MKKAWGWWQELQRPSRSAYGTLQDAMQISGIQAAASGHNNGGRDEVGVEM